jgi:hypothetical protein
MNEPSARVDLGWAVWSLRPAISRQFVVEICCRYRYTMHRQADDLRADGSASFASIYQRASVGLLVFGPVGGGGEGALKPPQTKCFLREDLSFFKVIFTRAARSDNHQLQSAFVYGELRIPVAEAAVKQPVCCR